MLDAKLRAAATALAPALDAAADAEASDPLDPLALRLQADGVRSPVPGTHVVAFDLLQEGVKTACSRASVHRSRLGSGPQVLLCGVLPGPNRTTPGALSHAQTSIPLQIWLPAAPPASPIA